MTARTVFATCTACHYDGEFSDVVLGEQDVFGFCPQCKTLIEWRTIPQSIDYLRDLVHIPELADEAADYLRGFRTEPAEGAAVSQQSAELARSPRQSGAGSFLLRLGALLHRPIR